MNATASPITELVTDVAGYGALSILAAGALVTIAGRLYAAHRLRRYNRQLAADYAALELELGR